MILDCGKASDLSSSRKCAIVRRSGAPSIPEPQTTRMSSVEADWDYLEIGLTEFGHETTTELVVILVRGLSLFNTQSASFAQYTDCRENSLRAKRPIGD